jgi:polysaccharide biosynthesis transport protein
MLQRNVDHHADDFGRAVPARFDARPRSRGGEAEAFGTILRNLKRSVRLIMMLTLVGTGCAAFVTINLTPQYLASTTILVDPRKTQILKDREIVGGPGTDNSAIESEAEMLQSPALARRVVEHLSLHDDEEFARTRGLVARILATAGALLRPARIGSDAPREADPISGASEALQKKVSAKRRNLTYVIEVNAWSQDAEKAARIANAIAELYLTDQIAAKSTAATHANQLLNQRVEELRNRVTASEKAYEAYKAETGLFDPGGQSLSDRQISQLNEQLVTARARAAEARAKYEQLQKITPSKLLSAAASPDVLQSSVVSNLRMQYAEVGRKKAELTTRYGERHPQVVNVEAEIANISKQITDEIRRIVASAHTEFEMASNRERSLQTSLDDLKGRAANYNQQAIRLHELEREAQANRGLFEAVLTRAKETSAQLNMQLPDSRVISAATTPNAPSYPRKGLMVGLGFFGSFGLGLALALARSTFNQGFRRIGDLRTTFGLQPLATIPLVEVLRPLPRGRNGLRLDRYAPENGSATSRRLANLVLQDPTSIFAESIHSLRFALKSAITARETGVILVTSALPGEGKSTIAANLTRAAAAAGDRVLLIDADLRNQGLALAFGVAHSPGLAGFLTGESDLRSATHFEQHTGLQIIAGSGVSSGAEALALLSSDSMRALIDQARYQFDLIVIDAPPLLTVADPRVLLDQVDGVVLVVASDTTSEDTLAAVFQETLGVEDKIIGAVLNRAANDEFDRYHYGYRRPPAAALSANT